MGKRTSVVVGLHLWTHVQHPGLLACLAHPRLWRRRNVAVCASDGAAMSLRVSP